MNRYQLFPALAPATEAALVASIQRFGVLVPVVKDQDGNMLDGHHRSRIADELGVDYRVDRVIVADEAEREAIIATLNVDRGHRVSADMRRLVAADLRDGGHSFPAIAKALGVSVGTAYNDVQAFNAEKLESERVSPDRVTGLDGRNRPAKRPTVISTANQRRDHQAQTALSDPTVVEKLQTGAAQTLTEAKRLARKDSLSDRVASLPAGTYRVLYVDPPWQYSDARATGDHWETTAAETHYPTMPLTDLMALGVRSLAAPDSVLFLWATFPLLGEALALVGAWGFNYKTAFVWSKGRGTFGHYHTADAELLIIATRGSCVPDVDVREAQVQSVPRDGRHSQKPEYFRALVDRLYPLGPRIELFARGEAAPGWNTWGNEAE